MIYGNMGHFHPGIIVGVEDDELWVTAAPDTYEPGYMEAEVKINFCPMCGEKLKKRSKLIL